MQLKVTTVDGRVTDIAITPGDTLARAIYLSGAFAPRPLCSGLGNCGLCRVRFLSAPPAATPKDEAVLGSEDVAKGWRLGCRHQAAPGDEVLLPPDALQNTDVAKTAHADAAHSGTTPAAPAPKTLALAVDLGTTSLVWSACEPGGATVAQGRELNPQIGAGSDVLSRLSAAMTPGGSARLQKATLDALRRILAGLPAPVSRICLAANTAMTALTRGASVQGLAAAPYGLEFHGHCEENLPGLPPIYFPPQAAPFIGGDISAGMAALLRQNPEFPFLLADMGTNGEFVLALAPEESLAVSVPLGPALEGIGLSCGALAGVGGEKNVITAFSLTPTGLQPVCVNVEDDTKNTDPQTRATETGAAHYSGISGTGYLSLVHILRNLDLVREDGRFNESPVLPLAQKLTRDLRIHAGQMELELPGKLRLTGTDIEEILKVKAAFSLALHSLLRAARLTPADLQSCCLAGALGRHVRVDDLFALGFFPAALKADKVKAMGNTALAGAELMLADPGARDLAAQWTAGTRVLNLTKDNTFMQLYLNHMRFSFPAHDQN